MANEFELVGMGLSNFKGAEYWCVTYEKAPAEDEGGIPDFHHHLFPPTIFSSYAEQFGLDVDEPDDFDEILEIVLYGDGFGGDDNSDDDIEPSQQARGLKDGNKPERKNRLGRKMRRRADRAKNNATITGIGIEGIREQLRADRHRGVDELKKRRERVEKSGANRSIR